MESNPGTYSDEHKSGCSAVKRNHGDVLSKASQITEQAVTCLELVLSMSCKQQTNILPVMDCYQSTCSTKQQVMSQFGIVSDQHTPYLVSRYFA